MPMLAISTDHMLQDNVCVTKYSMTTLGFSNYYTCIDFVQTVDCLYRWMVPKCAQNTVPQKSFNGTVNIESL